MKTLDYMQEFINAIDGQIEEYREAAISYAHHPLGVIGFSSLQSKIICLLDFRKKVLEVKNENT